MNVLIVEDEPYARTELQRLLTKLDRQLSVLDCLDSVEETVEWISGNPAPDLIFLDIQLSDGLSFEIFHQVEIKIPVIFTTAYDEYAIKAFKVNSIDYLLKPIKLEELKDALTKFDELHQQPGNRNSGLNIKQVERLLEIHKPEYKSRFVAKVGDQIKTIDINRVAYFKAEDNEVMLITGENNRYIIDYTLDHLVGLLNPNDFYRINRSYIISPGSIKKISKYFNSRLNVELAPGSDETVLISRVKVPEFMNWMDK